MRVEKGCAVTHSWMSGHSAPVSGGSLNARIKEY